MKHVLQGLEPVDAAFFSDEDRERAVAAGVAFVNALRRLGADLPDIQLREACITCDERYSFTLGDARVEDLREMAWSINRRLNLLEAVQRQWLADNPQAPEVNDPQASRAPGW
ncbi:hypothetical protein [Streptomyces sp. NPDC093707]|uniref:hypothetical protein n=1 Tax=Streptomyces sp. NPDC093707 TaxID=3154984 RepID=UPI00344F8A50